MTELFARVWGSLLRGGDGAFCAGVTELFARGVGAFCAGVAELCCVGVAGKGLGARRGEIPAASAGMTELCCAGMTELVARG